MQALQSCVELQGSLKVLCNLPGLPLQSQGEKVRDRSGRFIKGYSLWKGKHHSAKTKKKLSEMFKGKHRSPETEFKKGNVPWNTGKHHSIQTKKKLSDMFKGKHFSSDTEFKRGHGVKIVNLAPSPTLSYVLGVVLGDGCAIWDESKPRYVVKLGNNNEAFVEEFGEALKSLGFKPRIYDYIDKRPWKREPIVFHTVVASSKHFVGWYKSLELGEIEEIVEPYSREFLRGFYQSEGCYRNNPKHCTLSMSNNNIKLLRIVQRFLGRRGFKSAINKGAKKCYYVAIHGGGRAHKEFLTFIGFPLP